MVFSAEPVVVNRGLLCRAKGSESWRAILSQWLLIMVCSNIPLVVNHDEYC
jgi:hypothetical protein